MQESSFAACLTALQQSGVNFILVGGLAAVLQGAPLQTYDVDIVYFRTNENVERLLALLNSIDAIFRIQPARRIRPKATHLLSGGHLNLLTRFGPLDVLGTIGDGLTYPDLLPHVQEMSVSDSVRIKVLKLEEIIAIKEKLGSEKDIAALPILRQTIEEAKKKRRDQG